MAPNGIQDSLARRLDGARLWHEENFFGRQGHKPIRPGSGTGR